ncbi:hypothetical protein LCGC14_0909330 [marine sediment metagenome]|uniref:Uncharacterized protein n=1 Tax=marine sediment metagenome TaxID=412755 RepID=A0A0F9RCZ9_9ZZZZ
MTNDVYCRIRTAAHGPHGDYGGATTVGGVTSTQTRAAIRAWVIRRCWSHVTIRLPRHALLRTIKDQLEPM